MGPLVKLTPEVYNLITGGWKKPDANTNANPAASTATAADAAQPAATTAAAEVDAKKQ
jgi:hypothetical protein